jgi:hypothetical protein
MMESLVITDIIIAMVALLYCGPFWFPQAQNYRARFTLDFFFFFLASLKEFNFRQAKLQRLRLVQNSQ